MNDRELASSPLQPIVQGSSDETPTVEPSVQGIADMLAEMLAIAKKMEQVADKELDACGGPITGGHDYHRCLARWSRLTDLTFALSKALDASQKALRTEGQANHAIP